MKFLFLFSLPVLLYSVFSLFRIALSPMPDFAVYYESARALFSEIISPKGVYDGYPLIPAMFFLPFSVFSQNIAQNIFLIISAASAVMTATISLKTLGLKTKIPVYFLILSLVFLSFPVKFTLGMGQINLVSGAFLILNFYFYKKGRPKTAGIFLGLSVWTKPQIAPVVLFFLMKPKKNLKLLTVFFGFLAAISIAGLALFGFKNNSHVVRAVPYLLNFYGREVYYNQSLMGFFSRVTETIGLRVILSFMTGILLFLVSAFSYLKNKKDDIAFSTFVISTLLFNPLAWQHHFVFLVFPFIVAYYYSEKAQSIFLKLCLVISYLLLSGNIGNPGEFGGLAGGIILSHQLLGAVILFAILAKLASLTLKKSEYGILEWN